MNDKYSHYLKDEAIRKMLKKLQYAVKIAAKRIEEMEEDMMDNKDDDIEVIISESSKKHPKITSTIQNNWKCQARSQQPQVQSTRNQSFNSTA